MHSSSSSRAIAVSAALLASGFALAVAAGCTTFEPDVSSSDAGNEGGTVDAATGGDAAAPDRGIACANALCAPPNVCCFEADAGTESCTSKASCTGPAGVPFECKTTLECRDAGKPADFVCCGFNDGAVQLTRASCVQPSACDATGPQDWLCDPTAPTGTECIDPTRPKCKAGTFRGPVGIAYCGF